MSTGRLLVVSAPSGTGKTSIVKPVLDRLTNLAFSISHTTRQSRPGEEDGRDYHFVSMERFEAKRRQNDFLEWAKVHDNYYGTSREAVQKQLAAGVDVILDIDVQGAMQLKAAASLPASYIFIAPPSMTELERRLKGRQTENAASLHTRLANAAGELAQAGEYDYQIINDDLKMAIQTFEAIVIAIRAASGRDMRGEALTWPI
jgi:guanylate kinase